MVALEPFNFHPTLHRTIGAEDVLHELGAISIISSDSQAMGRVGEVISRTWQTAHKMKDKRGALTPGETSDNERIRPPSTRATLPSPTASHTLSDQLKQVSDEMSL